MGESWSFTYSTGALSDPFAGASYGTAATLSSVAPYNATLPPPSTFSYNSSAEMVQYTTPMGGSLSWTYLSFTYGSGITLREVNSRSMNDAAASLTNSWTITHPSLDYSLPYHSYTYLTDNGASSEKAYQSAIILAGLVVPVGYTEENSSGSSILLQKTFSWAQDTAGNSYVGTVASTLNPGTSYAASSHSVQTLDIYGNLTQQVVYDYGSATTPYLTYNFTYLNGSNYLSNYVRNRLTQATVTYSGGGQTLVSNTYDGTTLGALLDPTQNNGSYPSYQPTPTYHDPNYGLNFLYRGNLTSSYQYGTITNTAYLITGVPYLMQDGGGMKVNVATDTSTANSLPSALTPNSNSSLTTSLNYSSSFTLTSVTGPNGVNQSVDYGTTGLPSQATSADGAVTIYTYTWSPTNTQTATVSTTTNGTTTTQWKTTTFDGFGRTTRVQTGHDAVPVTNVDTKYAACGCSPLGKVSATSMPYAPGAMVYWTMNLYDTSGRITTQTKPDGSTTYTGYWGNEVVVMDPAGKWKAYYNYVTGKPEYVQEPDPGGVSPFTYYAYNGAGQLTFVAVSRAGVTQYREYAWSGSDLVSSTDPETGTTTYQYDGNHHVTLRTDAKNQQTKYTYDLNERLIETQYYTPTGYLGAPVEVVGERVTYGYDSNPNNPYDYYVWGRLGTVSFSNGSFSYYYDYNQAGRVTANQFQASDGVNTIFNLQANYSWDTQGRMTSMTYPSGPTLNYQYDNVGRLSQITSPNYASPNPNYPATVSATYNGASQLSTLNYGFGSEFTETRGYNSLMQLTDLVTTSPLGTVMNMQYNYNNGTNNGRVASTVDQVLGETVNYTYDMWNRLTAASATNGNWGEQYTFDNFGNLTAKTPTAGSAPPLSLSYNLSTNRPTGGSYDANGNPTPGSNYPGVPGYVWDVENRLVTNQTNVSQATSYTYDPWGRRVWAQTEYGRDQNGNPIPYTGEAYFYGATGQKLETYSFTWGSTFGAGLEGINIYFGGKLLQSKGVWVATDRVGSVRANSNGEVMNYWPYGEERTSTANGREKFGTYTRDGLGQDYAMARYYDSGIGAFWTPDPGGISTANPKNPTSWNRYAYVVGDPINHTDRHGLYLDAQDCINDTEACTDCIPIGSLLEAPPGCDDDGGGGGGDASEGTRDDDEPDPFVCPQQYQDYISAYGEDAVATGLSEANVLALSAIESGWGTGRFATEGKDFFNLETVWKPGTPRPKPMYAYQVSWIKANEMFTSGSNKGKYSLVASYNSALDSFRSFAATLGTYFSGVTNPATFGSIAVAHGENGGRGAGFVPTSQTFTDCLNAQNQ